MIYGWFNLYIGVNVVLSKGRVSLVINGCVLS